jgi:phage host-nuclease inhibitor protein Gam
MSHLTPYADKLLSSAASVGMPAPAATTVSEANMIAQLQRENARLQTEIDGAKGRAAQRHKEMLHANRRAERAQDTLDRNVEEWKATEAKNYRLYCGYTQTIEDLEAQVENQKIQAQKEAREYHVKIAAETEERLRKQFKDEIGAARLQFQAALQATKNEVKDLKKQLQQFTEWQKVQGQQQIAQREATQSTQIAADIQSDFPLQQDTTVPVNTGGNKRQRQEPSGYVVART